MATATSTQMSEVDTSRYDVTVEAYTPSQIKSVLLSDGKWHNVRDCELIQFAIQNASSPISPQKLYPYLKFYDEISSKWVKMPFNQVLAFETK